MKNIYFLLILSVILCSCDDIIDEVDITNDTVGILAPTDDVTLTETSVRFSWNPIDGADRYKLQIATPDFANAITIVLDSMVTKTAFTQSLNSGDYQWRVRAENSNYQTVYTTRSLIINESEPIDISNEQVMLLAPASGTAFTPTDTINFSWDTITNADNYVIQIATPDFVNATEIIENETVTTTNFSVSNLNAQSYNWRVKATNANFETVYSTQNFTVAE